MKQLIFLLFPIVSFAQSVDVNHQLLWEISGNDLTEKSYLFGSFHSNDRRLFRLTDSTFYALNSSKKIVLEADVFSMFDELDTRLNSVDLKYDNNGAPYVSTAEATETNYGNEDGMPQFLDAFFQQYCYNAQKQFVPLETVKFQLAILNDIDAIDISKVRLESLLSNSEDFVDTYLTGDIYTLDEMLRASLTFYPNGYEKLITERNITMAAGLDSVLRVGGRTFCAVGAGHLPGTGGLINLLTQKGYRVRQVVASYSEKSSSDRDAVVDKRSFMYHNEELGVHIEFPGKPLEVVDEFAEYELKLIYRELGQGNTYEVEIYPRDEGIGLEELASIYIASPAESPAVQIRLGNDGEAYEGIADSYPEGLYWVRVIMSEDSFMVIKAYGGNKFMNSTRPQRFFEKVRFH